MPMSLRTEFVQSNQLFILIWSHLNFILCIFFTWQNTLCTRFLYLKDCPSLCMPLETWLCTWDYCKTLLNPLEHTEHYCSVSFVSIQRNSVLITMLFLCKYFFYSSLYSHKTSEIMFQYETFPEIHWGKKIIIFHKNTSFAIQSSQWNTLFFQSWILY